MILAKPVIPDQFWILRENDRKIGNIQAKNGGYSININDHTVKVKTLSTLTKRMPIDFEPPQERAVLPANQVNGFPTTGFPHNAIFNVKYQLPLWTPEPRSKSWLAAGWYAIKQHRDWKVVLCPKLIMLERYEFRGPFVSEQDAENVV